MNTTPSKDRPRAARILMAAIGGLLLLGTIILVIKRPPPENLPQSAIAPVKVAAIALAPRDVTEDVTYLGHVQAQTAAVLAVEQAGQVVRLCVAKGERVAAQAPIVEIDRRAAEINRARAEINLRQADADLARWEELKKSGAAARSDYENFLTRRELAAVARDEAQLALEKCSLAAPFAGIVANTFVEQGELVAPGTKAAHLIDIDRVKIGIDVAERDVPILVTSAVTAITLDAFPNRTFEGKIAYIAPAANQRSNTFPVEIALGNPDHLLKPGMIARATLIRRTLPKALVIPLQALIPVKGQYVVFLAEGERAVRRVVTLAAIIANGAVVAEGLQAGDNVIVEGNRALADGTRIETRMNTE